MDREALKAKISQTKEQLEEAEREVDAALNELARGVRAEKTIVNEVVGSAFAKVRAARAKLAELEALLSEP